MQYETLESIFEFEISRIGCTKHIEFFENRFSCNILSYASFSKFEHFRSKLNFCGKLGDLDDFCSAWLKSDPLILLSKHLWFFGISINKMPKKFVLIF